VSRVTEKHYNMILLAPRSVQEQFTNTTTTRMLESHGLLSESGRHSARDQERLEREQREQKKREMELEKQRLKELKKESLKNKTKNKLKSWSPTSSSGSVSDRPGSSGGKVGSSSQPTSTRVSLENSTSERTLVSGSSQSSLSSWASSSRRTVHPLADDDLSFNDEDDDDDDDILYERRRRPHSRTPHSEAFGSIPTEDFELYEQQGSQSGGILNSFKKGLNSKSRNSSGARHYEKPFQPPWAVASQRHVDKKGIVQDLNISFQDVGLLPTSSEAKGVSVPPGKRKRAPQASKGSKTNKDGTPNVFHSFSADYLYMLLPLWPSETDPVNTLRYPYTAPVVPIEQRQFLLIYYKPDDVSTKSDAEKGGKGSGREGKKRQPAQTSRDGSHKSSGSSSGKSVLFEKFHFCARIVSFGDIQGSGVRSPDVGLSVLGPLQEAVETMPTHAYIDTFQVIGVCTSREKGIEFVPEGLEKLGLTRRVPEPVPASPDTDSQKRFSLTPVDEGDDFSDPSLTLTPIGRAVVEMAWLGSMALTSYGPNVA